MPSPGRLRVRPRLSCPRARGPKRLPFGCCAGGRSRRGQHCLATMAPHGSGTNAVPGAEVRWPRQGAFKSGYRLAGTNLREARIWPIPAEVTPAHVDYYRVSDGPGGKKREKPASPFDERYCAIEIAIPGWLNAPLTCMTTPSSGGNTKGGLLFAKSTAGFGTYTVI